MNSEIIEVKRDDLRELYQVLTNYPAISKEQVKNEMHKVFGEDTFKPKDIMERVKTFKDACRELGLDSEDLEQKWGDNNLMPDEIAYQKLRIICAALNEGWEPQFTEDEWRYYPWFWLYTQEEINDMDEDEKTNRRLMLTGDYQTGYAGLACADSDNAPSRTGTNVGSRLCLKSDTLAVYCGKQFINIWADYILIRK